MYVGGDNLDCFESYRNSIIFRNSITDIEEVFTLTQIKA